MKILATAKPNATYENIRCIEDLILEARLINNEIHYFETHIKDKTWVVEIPLKTINSLFSEEVQKKERPFLIWNNKVFWAVINRHEEKYKEIYKKLKHKK
jgi:hypothetical protein